MELNCALIGKKSFGEERDESIKYCDTPGMELVETIQIEFPDAHLEKDNNLKNFSGVTFDLTARKLVGNNPLQYSEIIERIGDFFGSIFIDNEFIKFLREKLGTRAIGLLMENNYDQSQCLMQEFCQHVKDPFTRDDTEYNYILDIKEKAPLLLSHVNRKTKKIMKKNEWLININYDDIKSMIKQEFNHTVKNISVPIVAIAHGAIIYGLSKKSNCLNNNSVEDNMKNIDSSRVLKYTLGIDVDSLYGKSNDVEIHRFWFWPIEVLQ
ncbi:14882_t:CDS:2 [Rhizophagus irregularis]|nr:14882_t:CDS:2 [Rhizophagus irregularis]